MAIQQEQEHWLDALYCDEAERWEEIIEEEEEEEEGFLQKEKDCFFGSLLLLEQDLFWEDEELISLLTKEKKQRQQNRNLETDSLLSLARHEAVNWILKVNSHYGFTTLTAILAINYLDSFLSSLHFQRDKPWMIQLLAVTCLSLAAKIEETQVPLLLDLQVEETKYVFEAKTIQRMELLVLSSLQWKMHPVTPFSFLDHVVRRLGLKNNLHWKFLRRCERLLLSLVSDSKFVCYLPSILATATMMHVVDQLEPLNAIDYQNQLLGVLKISKEEVNECYNNIVEVISSKDEVNSYNKSVKRKYEPGSPSGVIDATVFSCCDSSNDSWVAVSSISSSVASSPTMAEPLFKKSRVEDEQTPQQQTHLPSLNRVFVDILGSPS